MRAILDGLLTDPSQRPQSSSPARPEVSTSEGHLLALFVERPVPPGQTLIGTVLRVGDMGGLCIAPHPMAPWMPSLTPACIHGALARPDAAQTLVGSEVIYGGLPNPGNNRRAQALASRTSLSWLANSDSQLLWTIGLCATTFPGTSIAHLRQALKGRQTRPLVHARPASYYLSFAKGYLLRRIGLVWWTPEPGERIIVRRLADCQA